MRSLTIFFFFSRIRYGLLFIIDEHADNNVARTNESLSVDLGGPLPSAFNVVVVVVVVIVVVVVVVVPTF